MKAFIYTVISILISVMLKGQQLADTTDTDSKAEDTTAVKISRLKINSSKSDFSPYLLNNQLLFVSGRDKNLAVQYVDANNESDITDIYTSSMTAPTKFRNVNSLSSVINTKYHEGPFCFNKEGTVLYYTANEKKSTLLKIYKSEKINNAWTKPQMLSICLPPYSFCHPTLSSDGSFMIFSAGIDKENKGMDLYKSEFVNGSWLTPQPLSNVINDSSNQVFPFISASNILYFSSDKENGMGGLDIYYVSLGSDSMNVRSLMHPINSAFDDFGVWIDSTSSSGYFSSNRAGRTKDDIYYFSQSMPDFSDAKTVTAKKTFCYSFFEESTMDSKDTANLTYEWNFGDGKKGRGLKTRHCYAGPGNYQVDLNVVDKVSGELFTSEVSYPLIVEQPDLLYITSPDSSAVGQEINLSAGDCYLKDYEINKVYWSFGDGKYNSGKQVKHIYKKTGTYSVLAGIIAKNKSSGKTEQFKTEKTIAVNKLLYDK